MYRSERVSFRYSRQPVGGHKVLELTVTQRDMQRLKREMLEIDFVDFVVRYEQPQHLCQRVANCAHNANVCVNTTADMPLITTAQMLQTRHESVVSMGSVGKP